MFQKKTRTFSESEIARYESIEKALKSAEELNTQFSLIPSNITKAADALGAMADAASGQFDLPALEKFSLELDDLTAKRSKLLGITKVEADSIKESFAASYGALSQYGIKFGEVVSAQNLFIKEFNTNSKFSDEQTKSLLLTSKATGIETEKLVHNFREAGMGIEQMNKTMQTTMDYARSIGVASSAVLQKVTENIGKLNLYNFSDGEKGLAKMAAQSAMLGIDMSKAFGKAEELLDPQKAIDFSASLQRLGVTSSQLLDPLRAMDLAQNDPAELQNQMVELSKQFVRTKEDGSFEILPGAKRQLREVAQQLGMSADELASMGIKSAEAAKKLQEMRFPDGLKVSDDQKQLIANMASMGKGGQYEVEIKREEKDETGKILRTFTEKKAVTELNDDDLKLLAEQSQPVKLEDLSQKQLTQLESINNKIESVANRRLVGMGTSGVVTQMNTGAANFIDDQFKKFVEINGKNQDVILETFSDLKKVMSSNAAAKIESGNFDMKDFTTYSEDLIKKMTELYGKNITDFLKLTVSETIGETPQGEKIMEKLDDKETQQIIGAAALAMKNLAPEISKLVDYLKKLFKVNDAIIQGESSIVSLGSGEVVIPNEKDKIAIGTNLDGKNNTTNLQETLTRKTTPTQGVTVGESRVSVDLIPLTTLIAEFVKNNKPQTINLSGLEQLKPTNQPDSTEMLSELKKIISENPQYKGVSVSELISEFSKFKENLPNNNLSMSEIFSEFKKIISENPQNKGVSAPESSKSKEKSPNNNTTTTNNNLSSIEMLGELKKITLDNPKHKGVSVSELVSELSKFKESLPENNNLTTSDIFSEFKKMMMETKKDQSTFEVIKNMANNKGTEIKQPFNQKEETQKNLNIETPKLIKETTVPTFNPPQIARLEKPISTPTQKVEFGNLEISLKVDIPNSANVSTEQVKEVLQTAMNSADFKQKIVVAVNEAKTNYGLTSVGGTSNYGSTKTNYDLIA